MYQAMRVTGAADPTKPLSETLKGKLPQRKIVNSAAQGYSSYGNQIGLATGYVKEVYHPGYVAKRMEIGAVMGAAPRKDVIRETSDPGDIIILLGGRTTASAGPPVPPRSTPRRPLKCAAQRCRREMPPRSAKSRGCSAARR